MRNVKGKKKSGYLGNDFSYPRACDQFTDYVYAGSFE